MKAKQSAMLPVEAMRRLEARGAGVIAVAAVPWFASRAQISGGALGWRVVVMRLEALVYQPIFSIVRVSTGVLLGSMVAVDQTSNHHRAFVLGTHAPQNVEMAGSPGIIARP